MKADKLVPSGPRTPSRRLLLNDVIKARVLKCIQLNTLAGGTTNNEALALLVIHAQTGLRINQLLVGDTAKTYWAEHIESNSYVMDTILQLTTEIRYVVEETVDWSCLIEHVAESLLVHQGSTGVGKLSVISSSLKSSLTTDKPRALQFLAENPWIITIYLLSICDIPLNHLGLKSPGQK